jgi:DNA-binding NarL/FixJ family response regulator
MKCLLLDDHAMFRDALALLVAAQHPQVRLLPASRLAEALALLAADPALELVLLDLILPDSSGLETLRRVREHSPHARVIVLSADDRPETVLAAIDAGAAGFIPKTADAGVLQQALATVLAGGVYVPPMTLLVGGGAPAEGRSRSPETLDLSPRQIDVLRLLIEGHSNKVIARRLDISPSTVRTHVEALFERLSAHNRTQAVVAAARLGLRF